MSSRLCIDFGTSSIRAAVRVSDSSRPQVLPLGKAIKTKARDEASLLSEIYIDSKESVVIFGERALASRQQKLSDPYPIQSPKIWLKDPSRLKVPPYTDLPFTKVELLAGLLSYAIQAARISLKELGINFSPNQGNITVAHPVWPQEIEGDANRALAEILARAISIPDRFIDELAFESLKLCSSIGKVNHDVDVVEPIAAAYELSTVEINLRRLTLVVDVGAGTTDLGLFVHVESSLPQDRLIPLLPVRSEFCAGDLIDETLLRILQRKASLVNVLAVTEVQRRIRVVKETLFQQGRIFELGVELDLAELEESEEIKSMQTRIRLAAEEILTKNARNIIEWTTASSFQLQYVEVLMAGGGASIGFIKRALEHGFYPLENSRVLLRVVKQNPKIGVKTYGASVERLAVALGGADSGYEKLLITTTSRPLARGGVSNLRSTLGAPKQTFGLQSRHKAPESSDYEVRRSGPLGPTAVPWLSESSYNRLVGRVRPGSKPGRDVNEIEAYDSSVASEVHRNQVKEETSQSERQTLENGSSQRLRSWEKQRAELLRSSRKDSAEDQYKLACHLLEYPIQGFSPYKKSAIEKLNEAASLGSYLAASKLSSLYSESPVTKENSASGYYWYLVAGKLGQQGPSDIDPSVFIEELTEAEQNLASEMASKFRVLSSKPNLCFIRGDSDISNSKSRVTRTMHPRGAPQARSNINQGHILANSDQLMVLSLLKTSRKLRAPRDSDLASTSSIIRWARTSDFRGAMFLALRICPSLNTHDLFSNSDVYEQVKAWIEFAKRYERKR